MDIDRELERVIKKNKNRKYDTFETRVDLLAQDCLDEIRKLKAKIAGYERLSIVESDAYNEWENTPDHGQE